MDSDENTHRFSSSIPRPNRANSNGRSLHDITVSANNNAAGTMMPPPGTISRKHVESIVTESAMQTRKTLIERGGETRKKAHLSHSASKSMSSRPLSTLSTSTSSRPASAASRNAPHNQTSSSHGPSSRTRPSAHNIGRPQTSFGYSHSHRVASPRPVTSMSSRDDDSQDSVLGKRKVEAWDQDAKMEKMNAMCDLLLNRFQGTTNQSAGLKEAIELYKSRLQEVEEKNSQLSEHNITLRVDLDTTKSRLLAIENNLKDVSRDHEIAIDDLERQHRIDLDASRQEASKRIEELAVKHKEEMRELRSRFDNEIENERNRLRQELNQINAQTAIDLQRSQIEMENRDRELRDIQAEVNRLMSDLDRERTLNKELQHNMVKNASNTMTLESSVSALKARIEFLESGNKEQSDAFARLDQQLRDALAETQATKDKLRKEETLRRKLHNQVQELKGNIRVFCRVRPLLNNESVEDSARIEFPDSEADCKEISVLGPEEKSSLGSITTKTYAYSFDHVFGPSSQNTEVFEEISQLVQSALDGYNVCIFCYGQTGSGKTHTMSSEDGMIPCAVHQIYDTASALEEKGWHYTMQGNFVEVYNENLNDLLGKAEEFDKKKHEIRHDMQKCKTTITDITTVNLDSPARVESILRRAAMNRSVAATKANERSSRSHSVFILKLIGENRFTGEKSEGTLNLVDLAGSERLSHSKATGERLKETQSINRSLSCLGDVIGALGQGKEGGHIPYRNSKLTYLLQFSLGGNSKTLMFVMVSPRQEHLNETLTSLKFATKVHNTHIGTARKQTKMIRES
ncbi:kinesin motor domain-containing protein [Histoplasma ohiense]|nr:kinesin motor domain-containing protein [Histoplasma ohiense (nom. inval.)]